MSLDQHTHASTDWPLPSPSSTPESLTFPDSNLKTPKTETIPHSHFLDAWATPLPNAQQTPVQAPLFALSTPIDRPSSSYSQPVRTPEDPEFHVNHFAPQNLPLPPVDVSRRLASSPDPSQLNKVGAAPSQHHFASSRPISMDFSQMQTPPPTRDDSSRRNLQQSAGKGVATPATVIHRTPSQMPPSEALFDQTPFGFGNLQYTPDMMQFPGHDSMSAPPMPQSRLFWDPANDGIQMDLDLPMGVDAFAPTPQRMDQNMNWQGMHPAANIMQTPGFQSFQASPGPMSFANCHMEQGQMSRPGSFASATTGVDPNMLFSFSHPDMTASFGAMPQLSNIDMSLRQPYETQLRDAQAEREMAKKSRSQHSRSNTNSSSGSVEDVRPVLHRSNTDGGIRMSKVPLESWSTAPGNASNIPRRPSPLKRQSGGSLKSIPEIRRPRTRLVIDETGRARTETVPAIDDDKTPKALRQSSQQELRRQYPGLYEVDDSESEDDEPAATISRKTSFTVPQPERRAPKYARADSDSHERINPPPKMTRSASRPVAGTIDKPSLDKLRLAGRSASDNSTRRLGTMDLSASTKHSRNIEDQHMPDSPGDALGALKKVVGARQQRIERACASQATLKAHNQRWALAASAEFPNNSNNNTNNPSYLDPPHSNRSVTTTPSTDRSIASSQSTRCVCNGDNDDDEKAMLQCESCSMWLHLACIGLDKGSLPPVYVCVFCTGRTPLTRGGRSRGPPVQLDSPLTHKSVFRG